MTFFACGTTCNGHTELSLPTGEGTELKIAAIGSHERGDLKRGISVSERCDIQMYNGQI